MPRLVFIALICWAAAFAGTCALAGGMPAPNAAAVWQYITKTSPYKNWKQWPDYQGVHRSRSPHGPFHKVYVNAIGLSSKSAPVKYGTMEVKESLYKDGKIKEITVQYKVKGYNPKHGDWFWAKFTPWGGTEAAGKPSGCIFCHGSMADSDYIMVHRFR